MKRPIGKARRKALSRFLESPDNGANSAFHLWNGIFPYSRSHPQAPNHWVKRYYHIYYRGDKKRAGFYGAQDLEPMTKEDFDYIRELINIDPFLADKENAEFIE